jgi:hypothetical protein
VYVERIMQRSLDWEEAISDLCIRCTNVLKFECRMPLTLKLSGDN